MYMAEKILQNVLFKFSLHAQIKKVVKEHLYSFLRVANYPLKGNRSGETDQSISRTSDDLMLKVEKV